MYQTDNVVDKYYQCDSHVGCSRDYILIIEVGPGNTTSLSILYNI